MPSIKYLGPSSNDDDILSRIRLQGEISGNLTSASVDDLITTSLASKADNTYLSNRANQYVTPSALSSKGTALISKSTVNQPGGPVQLVSGRLPANDSLYPNQWGRNGGRSWNKPFEMNTSTVSLTIGTYQSTTEQSIGTFTVNGPSFAWIPIFVGFFSIGFGKGEVCIKRGTRYVARAVGANDQNNWFSCDVVPAEPVAYTGSQSFTVTRRSFFGSMSMSDNFHVSCLAVPA